MDKKTVVPETKGKGNELYPNLDILRVGEDSDDSNSSNSYGTDPDSSFEKLKLGRCQLNQSSSSASNSTPGSSPATKNKNEHGEDSQNYFITIAVLSVLLAIIIYFLISQQSYPEQQRPTTVNAEELYELQHLFPQQPNTMWTSIVAGVKTLYISDPQKPCILLFLLVDNDTDTSSIVRIKTAECIAKLVAKKVVSHMGSTNTPVIVDSGSLQAENYGKVIEELREVLRSVKALILTNLQDMSGRVAQCLHVLCDRENPAVSNALIAMTLRTSVYVEGFNHASLVQHVLWNKWKTEIKEDKLPALITRVIPILNAVVPEKSLPPECELDFAQ